MTGGRLTWAFVAMVTMRAMLLVLYGAGGGSYSYGGAHAWEQCSAERGGGTCPDGNTCCLIRQQHVSNGDDDDRSNNSSSTTTTTSGCIPSDLGTWNGTCCSHEDDDTLSSGCGVGYQCAGPRKTCHATATVTDPLVQTLPRYRLCHTLPPAMQAMYGLDLLGIIQRCRRDDDGTTGRKTRNKPQQQRRLAPSRIWSLRPNRAKSSAARLLGLGLPRRRLLRARLRRRARRSWSCYRSLRRESWPTMRWCRRTASSRSFQARAATLAFGT